LTLRSSQMNPLGCPEWCILNRTVYVGRMSHEMECALER